MMQKSDGDIFIWLTDELIPRIVIDNTLTLELKILVLDAALRTWFQLKVFFSQEF